MVDLLRRSGGSQQRSAAAMMICLLAAMAVACGGKAEDAETVARRIVDLPLEKRQECALGFWKEGRACLGPTFTLIRSSEFSLRSGAAILLGLAPLELRREVVRTLEADCARREYSEHIVGAMEGALSMSGAEGCGALLRLALDSGLLPRTRERAIGYLREAEGCPSGAVVSGLSTLTSDPEQSVRAKLASVFSGLAPGDLRVREALTRLFFDASSEVSATSARGLAKFGPEVISADVLRVYAGKDMVAAWNAQALVTTHLGTSALDRLSEFTEHTDPLVRRAAIMALGELGNKAEASIPRVAARLGDEVPAVRQLAVTSLAAICKGRRDLEERFFGYWMIWKEPADVARLFRMVLVEWEGVTVRLIGKLLDPSESSERKLRALEIAELLEAHALPLREKIAALLHDENQRVREEAEKVLRRVAK